MHSELRADSLTVGYGGTPILDDLSLTVTPGRITSIIGPNGCGKSTLLHTLSRLLKPAGGSVLLDGRDISSVPTKELARTLGLLPQSPTAPEGITVAELVGRGRSPHQNFLG